MSRQRLTELAIKNAPSPMDRAQIDLWDTTVPGLSVRVTSKGTKTFSFKYRDKSGREHRVKIGRYPDITLAEARTIAQSHRAEVGRGGNPAERKKREKVGTLTSLTEEFLERHASKNKTRAETERILNRNVLLILGTRDFTTIKKVDIIKLIEGIHDRGAPTHARNTLAAMRKLFNWAVSRDLLEASPCSGVAAPTKPSQRDRVLNDQELESVWRATNDLGWPFQPLIGLLILTGQRRAQITELRWSWIDFDQRIIVFPATMMKNAREHLLPMSSSVEAMLQSLPRFPNEDRVFPARNRNSTKAASGFSKVKARLDRLSGVSDWIIHDIRRTVSTGMIARGVPDQVVESVLSHVIPGVRGVYNRHKYVDEMRVALETWQTHPSLQSLPVPVRGTL
jgi:integrase